ncbi:hypothetical protein ACWGIU_03815 [Streptomyces sp. NPDC054840]
MLDLLSLRPREDIEHPTAHGPVRMRKYGRPGHEFVRAAVRDGEGRSRAALATLRPDAYPYAEAWLTAVARSAPVAADYRRPDMAPGSVRVVARMTRTHANGIPRQSDGSVGWSVPGPGASARGWPDGRRLCRRPSGPPCLYE